MTIHVNQIVLIRKILKKGKIVSLLDNDKFLISYYDKNNVFQYIIGDENDLLTDEEYLRLQRRTNRINRLLR